MKGKLDENFDVDFFRRLLREDVLRDKNYFKKSFQVFSKHENERPYELVNNVPKIQDDTFFNFVLTVYKKGIELDTDLIKQIDSAPKYVRFFLFPKNFDYSHFNLTWLLLYDPSLERDSVIYERFGEIKEIRRAVTQELKKRYHPKYAEIYTKYFM